MLCRVEATHALRLDSNSALSMMAYRRNSGDAMLTCSCEKLAALRLSEGQNSQQLSNLSDHNLTRKIFSYMTATSLNTVGVYHLCGVGLSWFLRTTIGQSKE